MVMSVNGLFCRQNRSSAATRCVRLSRSAASSQVCECSGVNDQVCECSRVNERIYRPVAIRSDAELTLLKMAFMRAS